MINGGYGERRFQNIQASGSRKTPQADGLKEVRLGLASRQEILR